MSTWFLEISALLAVLPVLDILVEQKFELSWIAVGGFVFSMIFGAIGLVLIPEEKKQ